MFWKKKAAITQPAPHYRCLGPDYLSEVYSDQGDSFDEIKEKLFACIQTRGFTSEQIAILNEKYDFDIRTGMIWIDADQYNNAGYIITEAACYRLIDFHSSLKAELIPAIMEYFNFKNFYNGTDINVVSDIMKTNLMEECKWEKYMKRTLKMEGMKDDIVYYLKAKPSLSQWMNG